ncbi:MAG: hypothetical protein QNI91_13980, partial [Arenicellales bacterium]|nr:hypothetical protein [Arenicellales bacterium]
MIVRAVHSKVGGRIRLDVAGLYRSPTMKRELEASLASVEGIYVVKANPKTGRLLVTFCTRRIIAKRLIDDIIELVVGQTNGRRKLRPLKKRKEPALTKLAYTVRQRINSLLGNLEAYQPSVIPLG